MTREQLNRLKQEVMTANNEDDFETLDDQRLFSDLADLLVFLDACLKVVESAKNLFTTRPASWNMDGVPELRKALEPFREGR